ncbi:hypothetical protein QQF64_024949 [Cirrhinus molitorella]|uniref:Uncharacterized protein n=1 Tax=Cirrhinus molitorella TaxID=172907 RepID=A0ABR3NMQ8_9TELE
MEHQHIYEIPSQDAARETVAVEMNNFSETDNEGVSPKVIYVRVKLKGKDYMCCSVFNIMFCNCLFLGFAALICSLKARSKMNDGDMVKAQKYSRRACRTNTMAVIVTSVALTVFLVFYCGQNQKPQIMVKVDTIHLEATLKQAITESGEEDGEGEDRNTSNTVRCK